MITRTLVLYFAAALAASAHVGSPDVFYEGNAGPYRLLVVVRPPVVIPGVAEVEVRSATPDVRQVRVVPLRLQGPGARFAPTPDVATRSADDPQFYTGSLWLMGFGAWQVRVEADGAKGKGEVAVPVPAMATRSSTMQKGLGAGLLVLMAVLVLGVVSIVGAGVREAQLEPGVAPPETNKRRAAVVMGITFLLVCLAVYLGNKWWALEATTYAANVYKPIQMTATVDNARLALQLQDTGWFRFSKLDDVVPDHGHLMHLYVISAPGMDRVWHLHPDELEPGNFGMNLPAMPAGRYRLYADVVHANGIGETGTAEITIPVIAGAPGGSDDAAGSGKPASQADFNRTTSPLSDNYRMVWERESAPLRTRRAELFRFRVEDANGRPAQDMELYMGMQGHAAFVRDDFQVFAHVHPSGSAPMAAMMMTRDSSGMHNMQSIAPGASPAEVSFPYGFPQPGSYRIFVQMKRAGKVETGIFDARVE